MGILIIRGRTKVRAAQKLIDAEKKEYCGFTRAQVMAYYSACLKAGLENRNKPVNKQRALLLAQNTPGFNIPGIENLYEAMYALGKREVTAIENEKLAIENENNAKAARNAATDAAAEEQGRRDMAELQEKHRAEREKDRKREWELEKANKPSVKRAQEERLTEQLVCGLLGGKDSGAIAQALSKLFSFSLERQILT